VSGVVWGAALMIGLLGACAGPGSPPAPGTEPGATASITASASASGTPPTGSATATAAPTGTSTTGTATCDSDHVTLSLQSRPQDSGAGNFFWNLVATNSGSTPCGVEGYPTVSLVSADSGGTIGGPPEPESGERVIPTPVTLAPGASAYGLLHLTQAGAYGCPMVSVAQVAVTLPGWPAAKRVATPNPIDGCNDVTTVLVRSGALAPAPLVF
jgi:hypothetical protein